MTITDPTTITEAAVALARGDLVETLLDGRLLAGLVFKKGSRGHVIHEQEGRIAVQFNDVSLSVRHYRPEDLKLVSSASEASDPHAV